MEALIRPFRPDDLDGLFVLDYRCYARPYRFGYQQLLLTLQQPETSALVIEAAGEEDGSRGDVIGGLIVRGRPLEREAAVISLMVAPEQRRLGLGTRMLQWALDFARNSQWTVLTVPVEQNNAAALAFLGANGLTDSGVAEPYYASPEVGTLWRLPLEEPRRS